VLGWLRRFPRVACLLGLVAVAGCIVGGTGYDYEPLQRGIVADVTGGADASRESRRLQAELARLTPRTSYIVIDRANNRLYLKRGQETLLEAVCSTGSGTILHTTDGEKTWTFDTPSGVFKVLSKTENPAWRKPEWAFVEEGRSVPGRLEDRIEYGTLGEYGLHFGNGYLIHGTLYERLLGRSVTHGCIRLGRDDLRTVYEASRLGTPVYIF
jgi:L,D-transpeptidase YbiS